MRAVSRGTCNRGQCSRGGCSRGRCSRGRRRRRGEEEKRRRQAQVKSNNPNNKWWGNTISCQEHRMGDFAKGKNLELYRRILQKRYILEGPWLQLGAKSVQWLQPRHHICLCHMLLWWSSNFIVRYNPSSCGLCTCIWQSAIFMHDITRSSIWPKASWKSRIKK